jgi:hypothetical protein
MDIQSPTTLYRVLTGASVLAVTCVEPIMFIGFTLTSKLSNMLGTPKSPLLAQRAFSGGDYESVVARTGGHTLILRLQVFFEELYQAVDQPAPATDHMQAALVLMLFENVVQLVFEFAHRKVSRIGFTPDLATVPAIYNLFTRDKETNLRLLSLH